MEKQTKQKIFDAITVIMLLVVFGLIIYKYYNDRFDFKIYLSDFNEPKDNLGYSKYLKNDENQGDVWIRITREYPESVNGKEIIYAFLDEGSISEADGILKNTYSIERYDPVQITPITWQEDPYSERYWRFLFYSLRPISNLLYAAEKTNDPRYDSKTKEIVNSFIENGMNKPNAWNDKHAVAFRTMVLTNIWWKLHERNALTEEESIKILKAIKVHGDFLLDEDNFEPGQNHGINEAAALFVLSVSFPDMPGSEQWLEVSKERLITVSNLIDPDGILIENSPYYHFYALEKYWQIYQYSSRYNISIGDFSGSKIDSMISYGARILQPNLESPLIGASLRRRFYLDGLYKQMAYKNPEFLYVLSNGQRGKEPSTKSIFYPNAGQTILRSGWKKDDKFKEQTQVIFDVGPYRTLHSHLDAFSFNLYYFGTNMVTDAGLYTYETGKYLDYFKGTYSHNTVVVDGKSQKEEGIILAGEFYDGKDYSYQTAMHELYDGVKHKRAMMLIQQNLVIIIDELESGKEHNYEQLFHLAPDAKLSIDGLDIIGNWAGKNQQIKIKQLLPSDLQLETQINDTSSPKGVCSYEYEKMVPCYFISYKAEAKNMRYITLIELGQEESITARLIDDNLLLITNNGKEYSINLSAAGNELTEESPKQISVKITAKRDWSHPYLMLKNLL